MAEYHLSVTILLIVLLCNCTGKQAYSNDKKHSDDYKSLWTRAGLVISASAI